MFSLHPRHEATQLSRAIVKQLLVLATGGFSLVAALAWNDLIKNFITTYITPYVSKGSGLIAQLIYATTITIIAVFITYQLGKIQHLLSDEEEEKKK
ncbi:hypothetical protein C5B42_04310 [Candidatus Cerribacteria bacterium 'Amazon FNV 2010 28 9']|uniref:Uncharacterized protein n=1 Tax=Candidatus Cerribacteria bacterium 'Amazon FNV 2010 28 9' TaxID=2081795 RepID=A0A317JNA1_9BACT|nr:MAG: hypothetical protein C5B42_04310 [Candidatus Cerribacteria bacterium 'Amazon FNV 2010 28 9']